MGCSGQEVGLLELGEATVVQLAQQSSAYARA